MTWYWNKQAKNEDIPCSWITIYFKCLYKHPYIDKKIYAYIEIHTLNVISFKIPMTFFIK